MGSTKELLRGALVGYWAWLLCGIATGAALPVPTEHPAIEDDYSTPNFPSTVIFGDSFGPTLPTTTEEDLDFLAETSFPSENGETPEAVGEGEKSSPGEPPSSGLASIKEDFGSLTSTPQTFNIPEDLKETLKVPSLDKSVLSQVNSSEPTLGNETLQGDPLAEPQEASKETPPPDSEAAHEATELITERDSGITDAPVTVLETLKEDLLASPSKEEAQTEISSKSPPEGDKLLEDVPGEPNLDEELNPTSITWEETEAAPLEAEKDTPEPSTDESGTLEDPSSNHTVFPSTPEDLPHQGTGENVDAGDLLSLSSEDSPETSQSSTGSPPIRPSLTHENIGSPGINDSLQPSHASVDSGSPEGRGDADPIPSSSGPELNHESPVDLPSEEPEDLVDAEASNSSPSSDSGPAGDTLVRTSQSDASEIPLMGLSVTPELPSQLPEDGEVGATSTVEEGEGEGEEDSGNPKSNEGTSLVSPLPGQESSQGTEIPDEERSADLLSGTDSSLNPEVETANSELEDSEATTTTSNSVPEDGINPISSDSGTVSEYESGVLFDTTASSPPPVDNEGTGKAQELSGETQESATEASAPASTDGPETEGNEDSPSGSPGNTGSSLDEVDTEANSEDGSGSDLSPPDTELSPISGTPLPMGRSGTLNDQLPPSQSLVENALTSGSSSSSEGEHTFPSTSPDEALSGPLISEPDTTELLSNSLPGSQTSSQLPKENDIETGSGDVEDSPPPVDNQGAAKAQGPPAETSAPGSTNEPSSEREGSEVLPSRSPGNMGSPSENSDTIPRVSSDEVDTQANSEDHSVPDLPPSDKELSSISGTSLATSSQPPKEDDTETHPEDPEDSVSINGEETSSAPSIINPQSALAEATEEPSISGDVSDGPIVSPKEERIGSTSEAGVNEEPLLDGDNTQDKINTPPSEPKLGSEDALETSISSSGDEPAVKSGTISPLVDTETSTETQEPSGETSSASIKDTLSNSENEDGEPSPSLSSETLDSSPGSEVVDENRDGEDGTGSVSNGGQPGSDFPVGQLVTSPVGGILALAPIEDGETSVPRDDAQSSTGAVSSEDATPQSASSSEGTETSASEPSAVGSQPPPDDEAAAPETSKETEQLQTSAASEEVSPMASSATESQEPTTSENGGFSGALNKESPAFPVEVAGSANSSPATDKSSQSLPDGVASSDGVEDSEDITNTIREESSQGLLDRGLESKTSTSEEDTEGRSDGQFSLNNNGTETATVESANNGGSQLLPDGALLSTTTGTSEISEGVNGKEGSLIPSAAESHSTTEEVEKANSESGILQESQPSLDGSPTTEVQDSKNAEAVEDTSNNGEKLSLTLSATASKSLGISDGEEDVSGGTGNGESPLPGEELEMTGSGSTNNAGAQPSETSDVSNRVEPLENSSSANEGEPPLGSSAAESSTALEDQEVSGKPSDGDGMEAVNPEPATNAEPQPSPNGAVGPGGATVSEEARTPEASGTSEGSLAASAPESQQAASSSNEEETSNTTANAGSQLPLDGKSTAGTPSSDGAEISGASSIVPGGEGPLSPSTSESLGDSSSTKEVGTASRKPTTDEGSQLSADGTSPDDSLASEGAEPTESHPIASGDKATLVPSATELQFPETSANENVLGGLENGESSVSPGGDIANAGPSNNAGSQTSPDSVATEGEEAATPEDNSVVSEKRLSLAPSSTEPQSPGMTPPASKDVSENLVNGEPSLSTDGEKDTADIGTAGVQTPTSSTGTGPNQNNIAEQFGQNSDSISGPPSADGAMISKSSGETSIPSSISSDGNLATQGTSQGSGAPDSSQPSSDIQGSLANPINAGPGEDSAPPLGDHISIGDILGVSDGPILDAKAGGEVLQEVSEALASVNNLIHPSSAEGTKPAAGQLSGVASPLAFLSPKNGLLVAPSNLGAPKLGNVVGKGSSLLTPEERSEVVDSVLAVHKGVSIASSADGVQSSLLGSKGSPTKGSKLVSGKPGPQGEADAPQLSSKPEVPAKGSKLVSGKPGLQGEADAPQLSSKPEVPAKGSALVSGKPGLQGEADAPQLSSKPEVPAKGSMLVSGKPGLQGEADAPQLSSKPEVPAKGSKLVSGKPGLQGEADAPQLSSKPEVPAKGSTLVSGKPGLQGEADAPQLSSKPEVPAKGSTLVSGKPGPQGEADAPQLSSKPEVPAKGSTLVSGKPGLQGEANAPQLSSKPEVPAKGSTLVSGKPGLQGKADAPQLSSKPEVPAKGSTLVSGKPGPQGKADAPQLSSKPEVPAKGSKLVSGKPGPQGEADAPQLSSKPEVPAKGSTLVSGKPGLQGEADAPQLSSKPEVPAKGSTLVSGKPGLQGEADAPQLSSKPDVLANSERTLPEKPGSASSDSTSASDENDSSSGPNSSEEHQTLMKGKVALDLSKAKPGGSQPGVHLALSGVGLLAAKSSERAGKTSKKKSESKKSKDKKTKPDEKPAVIPGAPSGAAVFLYPYGASVNDKQYVQRKVDFNSPLFKPDIGIPLGKTLRNSLYFTDNGQIVFPASDKDISSYPNPPSGGFNGREKVPMVAVFWDNADFSRGSGTIFYQEYPCGNSAKHPLVQDVEAKIRQYVSSSYRARWLLKVTWDKVQAYPAQRQTSKTNTYQAILTTDGYRTYALFLYQDGGMQWDYTKRSAPNVLIGYTSGDGYFKNDHLMTQPPAEKYRPDRFQGYNTGVRGLWIYKLDSWIRVNYRQRCLDWLGHERLPSAWNRNLPACPCSLQQGMSDNRYTTSQRGWQDSGSTLLYSSGPNHYGAGVRCVYDKNGQLQEGRQERIWKKSRKNYPNNDEELKLHDWCCNKAGNPQMCEKYDQKRPRIGCQGYKPTI